MAALVASPPLLADPQMQRIVPAALTLGIGGESKLLAFSGKDLQLIKEVTVASAAPGQFSLTLGPASANGADRQLLIKANPKAAPGIYRLRILFTTRGGILLDPRMIKLRVMPDTVANRSADRSMGQVARPQRQAPTSIGAGANKQQPPSGITAAEPEVERAVPIAELETVTLESGIPPEPEVVGDGQSSAEEGPRATRGGDARDEKTFNEFGGVPLRGSASTTADTGRSAVIDSEPLPKGGLSAAMLAEAMGESSSEAMLAGGDGVDVQPGNVVPEEANRSTWLKLARSAGDTPRLALLAPAGQKSFMRGYFASAQEAKVVVLGAAVRELDLPRSPIDEKSNQGPGVNARVQIPPSEDSSPEYLMVEPVPERVEPLVGSVKPLPTPAPPVLLPRVRPKPVLRPKPVAERPLITEFPAVLEPEVAVPEITSPVPDKEPEVASRPNPEPVKVKSAEATVTASAGVTAGMRALPVYWIRGMAPTAILVGSVRNAQTGEPIGGAELQLGTSVVTTTAAGLYSLPSEDDSRQLKVVANGYLPMQLTAPRQSGAQMDEVDVSLIPVKPTSREENLPDLMVVSPPTNPMCRGDRQAVRVRIFNAGRLPVKNYDVTIFSRQWRDGSPQEGVNDDPISIDGPPLGAGETRVVDVPVTIAADGLWAEMTAEVDAKSRYDELLETNNRSNPRRIVVASLPDCETASVDLPDYAMLPSLSIVEADGEQGCQLETAVTLANYSNKSAPPVSVTLAMDSAGDRIFTKSLQLKGLGAAEQQDLRFAAPVDALLRALSRSLSLPSLLPDQRMTLSVEVNAELEQDERFTTNNRVEFSGRLSEFIASDNLLYRKRGEACLATL